MSRGSFRYKEKITKRTKCELKGSQEVDNGVLLIFEDPSTRQIHEIEVKNLNGKCTLQYLNQVEGINRYWITFKTSSTERIYGCGEHYSKFNLKKQKVRIFVAEHQNTNRIARKVIRNKLLGKDAN